MERKNYDIETLRRGMRAMVDDIPEQMEKQALVTALADDIRAMTAHGYTLADVSDYIRDNAGVDIAPKALSVYLARARKKEKR